jgi:hypothetical protein
MTIASPEQVKLPPPTLSHGGEPGSVLVFPKFVRGTVQVGATTTRPATPILEPRSAFEISVTCPADATCAEGQRVKLRARWVCPGSQDLRKKFICKDTDFELFTTVKGTLWFNPESVGSSSLPAGHPIIPRPPCERGYLIVWVVSPLDADDPRPVKFDGLVGNAVIRNSANSAGAYNAVPIQAIAALATGALTDVGDGFGGAPDGKLQFDGRTEYKAITGQVRGTVRYERTANPAGTTLGRITTSVTLLTLDTITNRPNFPTFVDLHFFNEGEVLLSTSHEFICWSEARLTSIDPNLDEFFGKKGLLESTQAVKVPIWGVTDTPGRVTLLGLVETVELTAGGAIQREYSNLLNNDGRAVSTTFEPN